MVCNIHVLYLTSHLYFSNDVDRLRQAVLLEEFG